MENTENVNKEKQQGPIKVWQFWVLILFSAAGMFFVGYNYNSALEKERQAHSKTQAELNKERSSKTSCFATRDSLFRENARLSIYKSLSLAMVHRDEATKELKYQFGDVAHMKLDSSRVVIKAVIIGGSKYDYYIKYKVQYKDKTVEEVEPELLY